MPDERSGPKRLIGAMLPNVGVSLRRFFFAVLIAAVFTLFHVFELNHALDLSSHETVRLSFALISAFLLSLGVTLFAERRRSPALHCWLLGFGALAIAALHLFAEALAFQPYLFAAAMINFTGLAAYLGRDVDGGLAAFWQFNHRLWLGAGLALVGAVLFAGGLALTIETLELLFEFDFPAKTHEKIWIAALGFVAPVSWLSLLPRDFAETVPEGEQVEFTSRAVATIVKYILAPLLLVYTVILYAYAAKIAIDGVLPKGRLGPMVLAYGATGTLTVLFAFPTRAAGGPLVALFWRHWFWLTIGPVVLLFLAAYERVAQYGVTEERYLVLLAGLWLATLALAFTLWRHDRDIRIPPLTLMGLLLLASLGPWGAVGLSVRSQTGELSALLQQTGRLEAGRVVPSNPDDRLSAADARRVRSIVTYLHRHRRLRRIAPWFAGTADDPFAAAEGDGRLASRVMARLGAPPRMAVAESGGERISYNIDVPGTIDVAAYAQIAGPYRVRLGSGKPELSFAVPRGGSAGLSMSISQDRIVLADPASGARLALGTVDLIHRTLARGVQRRSSEGKVLAFTLGALQVGLLFERFSGRADANRVYDFNAVLWVFTGLPPAGEPR